MLKAHSILNRKMNFWEAQQSARMRIKCFGAHQGLSLERCKKSLVHNVMIDLLHRGDVDLIIGIYLIPKDN